MSVVKVVLLSSCYSVDTVTDVFILSLVSAYTEPFPMNPISAGLSAEEDHGRTSEEEEGVGEPSYDRQVRYGTWRQMEAG